MCKLHNRGVFSINSYAFLEFLLAILTRAFNYTYSESCIAYKFDKKEKKEKSRTRLTSTKVKKGEEKEKEKHLSEKERSAHNRAN